MLNIKENEVKPLVKVSESVPIVKVSESVPLPTISPQTPLKILGMVKTLNVHGGVRRYFELGNAFVDRGNEYHLTAVQTKEKQPWLTFKGKAAYYEEWLNSKYDIAFTGANECFNDLLVQKADHRVIFVVAKFYAEKYLKLWQQHGSKFKWIGVAKDWNLGMEEIEGTCIPGGVNTNFFYGFFPEERERLTVSFYARKGQGRGVERILDLAKKFPDIRFIGFDARNYDTISPDASNVEIRITDSQNDLRDILHQSDVVVSAMDSAGWNNVIAEGMACGCVPIATEAGTGDLILPERTGFVFRKENFNDYAAQCLELLSQNHALKDNMARRASCWVKQYDWGIVAEKVLTEVMK